MVFYANGTNCTAKRALPGGSAFWDGKPVSLEAGREYALGMMTIVETRLQLPVISSTTCGMQIVSFKPEPNGVYKFTYAAEKAEKKCHIRLLRVGADGRETAESTARWRQPLPIQSSDAPECAA